MPHAAAHVRELELTGVPPGSVRHFWLHLVNDGIGEPIRIPIAIARGVSDGPVLGLTAAIHGNELNGIPVIQKVFAALDPKQLRGTVIGAFALNPPGVQRQQRGYSDAVDLNRIAPGKPNGTMSEVYANRIVERVIRKFDVHIDLHTASFGRVNSHYVRADMNHELTARLARLQAPTIIVHNAPGDGTLRGAASHLGVASITVELRDPNVFQRGIVDDGMVGIQNVLYDLGMVEGAVSCAIEDTTLCSRSVWSYTDEGGLLWVFPKVGTLVDKGQLVAEVRTVFGQTVQQYTASEAGIVIGRSVNPVNPTGSRILHLGLEPKTIPCIVREP